MDADLGREAVTYFHNYSLSVGAGYSETFESLLSKVFGSQPDIYLDGLGGAIREIGMNTSQVHDAMAALAVTSNGQIPRKELFFSALSNRISNPTASDFIGAAPEILGGMAMDTAKGFQVLGDSLITLGGSLASVGPLIILAGVCLLVYNFAENPGKIVKGFVP